MRTEDRHLPGYTSHDLMLILTIIKCLPRSQLDVRYCLPGTDKLLNGRVDCMAVMIFFYNFIKNSSFFRIAFRLIYRYRLSCE